MGNVSVHDLVPVQPEERKDLDLMQNLDYKTYQKVNFHVIQICFGQLEIIQKFFFYSLSQKQFLSVSEASFRFPRN